MSQQQLISLYKLDLADLLRIDAHYARLNDAELNKILPSAYDLDTLRDALIRGKFFYCTDTPALQLIFYHQGKYYINPTASTSAGEKVINALKNRFPQLNSEEKAPYQIFESLTGSGIRTSYWPPRTGSAILVNYTPDPKTANITPIEKTVKDWLTIRFYRLNDKREREYLEGVPYSINNKYQPADRSIFEQGLSPEGGTLHYEDMPYDDFYTVHYGLPESKEYTQEKLICVRKKNELEVITQWQLSDFYLKASGKRSKTYRLESPPKSPMVNQGDDNFNFAPAYENIEICYIIDDPYALVKSGKLEIFSRFEKKPLWTLDLNKLGDQWIKHGEHTVKWDGRVFKGENKISGIVNGKKISHNITTESADKNINAEAFPDGYVTLANTPFKCRLSLKPKDPSNVGLVTTSWTFFHILIKKMAIELGEEAIIPADTVDDDEHKRAKALRAKIHSDGALPAAGTMRKINLISNLYKAANGEMNDNTAYTQYEQLWGDGAEIPLIAQVFIADSAGNEVKLADQEKGAEALGKVKFLWDWEDPTENVTSQQNATAPYNTKPKGFIEAAIDYYKNGTDPTRAGDDHTYPKGDNCHVDRGGKRGPAAKAIFPDQAGYQAKATLDVGKFPFKVEGCKNRKWAAFSYGWTSGKLKGATGVVFQPSRMAGDDYIISVYLAYDVSAKDTWILDDKTEPLVAPASIKASTGNWQMWREVHIARYIRKQNTIAAYVPANIASIEGIFDDAYVNVEDIMDAANDNYLVSDHCKANGIAVDYDVLAQEKLDATANPIITNDLAIDRNAIHSAVDSGFESFTYRRFIQNLHVFIHNARAAGDFAIAAVSNGTTANALINGLATFVFGPAPHSREVQRLLATQRWLARNRLTTLQEYSNLLDHVAISALTALVKDGTDFAAIAGSKSGQPAGAKEGITVTHFNYSHTYLRDLVAAGTAGISIVNGAAIDTTDANRNHCVFLFTNAQLDTFCHEIGHHMFLPHARFSQRPGRAPGGAQAARHDDVDRNCLMSYNRPRHAFCGLCQLRLRGWDATKLDKMLANNKKP